MNHTLNYKNYIEKVINEHTRAITRQLAATNQDDEDHFDPVDFYSGDGDGDDSKATESIGSQNENLAVPASTTMSTPNLRRSGRPKPAAEALISSPPAIKFYESTVIRSKGNRDSTLKPRSTSSRSAKVSNTQFRNNSDKIAMEQPVPALNESSVLKLRLPMGSQSSSKENISSTTDKR